MITIINTLFWIFLHFGVAFLFGRLPENFRLRTFNNKRKFFIVSEKEILFYKKIRLPKWKDKLPQYNKGFNKRNLSNEISKEYLELFINVTCQAEMVHYIIIPLGYFSVFFTLLTNKPEYWFFIFILIATFIGVCNMAFSFIQRYNRFRLEKLLLKRGRTKNQ
ncbi:MAG: hypothetical protein LBB89_06085 [Treponema sp.]|jgi:hypothetical protein|nr:hypothetical protein [Treponema sp.]